jgi:hypothetical protein
MSGRETDPERALVVKELGRLIGLALPDEDLQPLAEALAEQSQLLRRLPAGDLAEVTPALLFDPRWHD